MGRTIARAYLEALASHDPSSEYIGRATMEILERRLNSRGGQAQLYPAA